MLGKPKFKHGDKVKFTLQGVTYHGFVYIIDEYGTFEDNSDVSYDVMINDWGDNRDKECLVKHLTERLVSADE